MMMKRIAWVGGLSVALLIGGVMGASAVKQISAASGTKQGTLIGAEKAREAALKVVSGRVEGVELERNSRGVYYEVEIETAERDDYDVYIDAYSGATLSSRIDDRDDRDDDGPGAIASPSPASSPAPNASAAPGSTAPAASAAPSPTAKPSSEPGSKTSSVPASNPANGKTITAEAAGKLAAEHVGGTVVKVKKDRDDGRLVYEVKLRLDGGRAEVEVDAVTGQIVESDTDYDDDDDDWNDDWSDDDDDDNDDDDKDDDNDDGYDD
ncbi:PepSY domain-containing protein [Paenibacillus soyae]|uniref:PepSY domain-containing protein n=1 Tax=Paenibacillus soyae TaxID=2969249 RepID=A0A9X2SCC2_9BACL|nr:PepSY domain-containing protein [Paenibacillus soyae]MCR2806603.1 PepSY domain-containing protein [Paenibacillus soyae]